MSTEAGVLPVPPERGGKNAESLTVRTSSTVPMKLTVSRIGRAFASYWYVITPYGCVCAVPFVDSLDVRKSHPEGDGKSDGVDSNVNDSSLNSVHGVPPVHPASVWLDVLPKASMTNDVAVVAVPAVALCGKGAVTADDGAASSGASSATTAPLVVDVDGEKF